jgi:cytochrome c oxidase subunit 2
MKAAGPPGTSPPRRRLLLAAAAVLGGAASGRGAAQAPREIEVVARRFKYTPEEIPIKVGERVVLVLSAVDFAHGFSLPDLGLRADLMPGRATRVEVVARKAGTLEFLCDNFCGDDHEDMHGRLLVSG